VGIRDEPEVIHRQSRHLLKDVEVHVGETIGLNMIEEPLDTGCIEGFFKAENCKENVVESINTISLFCVPESVIKFRPSPRS